MREAYDVDIKDFEMRATDGLLKGIAQRMGKGYEYVRQCLRDSEKTSWYEEFFTFWLAVHAEDPARADMYFHDFKARRDAMGGKSKFDDRDLIGAAVRGTGTSLDAIVKQDAAAMKAEIPQLIAVYEEILANLETEPDVSEFRKRA